LDVSDRITRLRYNNEVAAGVSGSTVLADIDGLNSIEISVGLSPDWQKCSHSINRSGTTISWASQGDIAENSLIFVFLYT
jgi:hypothetical protein